MTLGCSQLPGILPGGEFIGKQETATLIPAVPACQGEVTIGGNSLLMIMHTADRW
jgi:hypothetical protein